MSSSGEHWILLKSDGLWGRESRERLTRQINAQRLL